MLSHWQVGRILGVTTKELGRTTEVELRNQMSCKVLNRYMYNNRNLLLRRRRKSHSKSRKEERGYMAVRILRQWHVGEGHQT